MAVIDQLKKLTRQLYPTGRAFRMSESKFVQRLDNALLKSEERAYNAAMSILFEILPDNDNFTEDDATRWEIRLGLITNSAVPLVDRVAAIRRKYNHPGDIPARQSADYLQQSLQLAGFDLYVYENIPEQDPSVFFGSGVSGIAVHATDVYHMSSDLYHGPSYSWPDVVANSIEWQNDQYFDIGGNLRRVFYICGNAPGVFANVNAERRTELRQLILKLKRAQKIAYLGINYI